MALTKITSDVIETGAITSDKLASGAVSASSLSSITTDNVSEGSTNTYFTNARARGSVSVTGGGLSYDSGTGVIQIGSIPNASLTNSSLTVNSNSVSLGGSVTLDTDDIGEGSTNLYFTNARAQGAISGGTGVTVSSGTISIGQDVATSSTPTFGNITTTGYIAGPATFTIDPAAVGDNTGTVVIAGNLQVDGTTTTINSTTMEVDDLNITLASGAANAAAANGAGITVDGASATITYDGTNDEWDFNKDINVTGTITSSGNITGTLATAAQPNITSLGTITGLTSSGTISINSSTSYGNLELGGADGGFIDFKTPFSDDKDARIIYQGTNFQISTHVDQPILIKHNTVTVLETSSSGIEITGSISVTGDITLTETQKIQSSESSGGSHLLLRDDNLGVTSNSMSLIGLNDILIGAKSNNSGTGNIYFGVGAENKASGSGWTDTLTILESGNVGIGTNNPYTLLELSSIDPIIRMTDSNGVADKSIYEMRAIGASGYESLEFRSVNDANSVYNKLLVLKHGGNVGIGTDSPSHALSISGTTSGKKLTMYLGGTAEDYSAVGAQRGESNVYCSSEIRFINESNSAGTGAISFATGDNSITERMRIASDGQLLINKTGSDVGASTNIVEADGNFRLQGGNRSIKFNNGSHEVVGLAQIASQKMQYASGRMTIDYGNSRVGIGTATYGVSPTHPLHVHMDVSNDTIDETKGLVKFQSTGGNGMIFGTIASSPYTSYIQSGYVVDTSLANYAISLNPLGGNVGIGVNDPDEKLEINGKTDYPYLKLSSTNNTSRYMRIGMANATDHVVEANGTSTQLLFKTAGSTRLTIDSSGNLSMGGTIDIGSNGVKASMIGRSATNSADANINFWDYNHATFPGHVHIVADSAGSDGTYGAGQIMFWTHNGSAFNVSGLIDKNGKFIIGDTASHTDDLLQIETPASGGGHGIQIRRNDSNSDQGIGHIQFGNNTDTDLAKISAKTDGSTDNARLVFSTQPSGGSSTERMTILESGNVVVGDNSLIGSRPTGSKLNIFGDGVTLRLDGGSNSTKSILFRGTSAGNPGEMYADGSLRLRTEDASTRISFHTNSTGTNNERMRIGSNGTTAIGNIAAGNFQGDEAVLELYNDTDSHDPQLYMRDVSAQTATGRQFSVMEGGIYLNGTGDQIKIPYTTQGGSWRKHLIIFDFVGVMYNNSSNGYIGGGKIAMSTLSTSHGASTLYQNYGMVTSVTHNPSTGQVFINLSSSIPTGLSNGNGIFMSYKILTESPDGDFIDINSTILV